MDGTCGRTGQWSPFRGRGERGGPGPWTIFSSLLSLQPRPDSIVLVTLQRKTMISIDLIEIEMIESRGDGD
jgi:hypothetical protein